MFEWDEAKREQNILKHGFDFVHADKILLHPHVRVPSRYEGGEPRFIAIGMIESSIATVVYTLRNDHYRIISLRKARDNEKQLYHHFIG